MPGWRYFPSYAAPPRCLSRACSSLGTEMHNELLDGLEHGPLHRFADYADLTGVIPSGGAGVYTIWDDGGGLVYAGIAGRNPLGKGLASRLRSHASGRRSGDQFCVYVADHYVLPDLTSEQIGDERGWRSYLTTDEEEPAEAVVYCPDCAEREFGPARRPRGER